MSSDQLSAEQEQAFSEWRALAAVAVETKTVNDALASGKAFARFHYLFVEIPDAGSGKVISFERSRSGQMGGA